jgi:cell wall-associated NlpC family hydrolase
MTVMTDASVMSRISDIQSRIAQFTGAGAGGAGGVNASSGTQFAQQLAAASGQGSDALASGTSGALDGDAVVADARQYLGVPYLWGGTDPSKGLDCSGLTQRVFADLGVQLPRTVSEQKDVGTAVPSMADARPGDLLVFGDHHIGIYVGDGKMLHAPHTGDRVKIADVYETPTRIRRVLPAGDGVLGTTASDAASSAYGVARPSALRQSGSTRFDALFAGAEQRYGLPSGMLKAVAQVESSFNPGAHSPAGAIGLMQLMPGTARDLGVDPSDPAQAVDGAARLLKHDLSQFGSTPLALAAYNAGAGAVQHYGGIPPYSETQAYVRRVMSLMGAAA